MTDDSRIHQRAKVALDVATGLLSSRPGFPVAADSQASGRNDAASVQPANDSSSVADGILIPSTVNYSTSGTFLGRYRLERIVGRGGMGVVWLGYDPQLNRQVAIKTVRPDCKLSVDALTLFLEEGRRLAALSHPGILPVYDCGSDDGICYLVSEYVPGGTLAHQMKQGPLSFARIVELIADVAQAAHFAHMRGIVHRDIKPGNILIREDGRPLLADFGLAIAEEEQLRAAPGTLGTFGYMAPEQMLDQSRFVDGRADVYSLGVVLYQLLTGRLPYVAATPGEYRELTMQREPRPPRSVRDDISVELESICLKCLARRPVDRYSTAGDLAVALRSQHGRRFARQSWLVGGIAAAIFLSLTIAFVISRMSPNRPAENKPIEQPVALRPEVPSESQPPTGRAVRVSELKISDSPQADWGIKDRGEALWFLSDNLVLFRVGDYQGGDLEFSVEIEQTSWTGELGVFWAYRDCPDQPGWRQYESLQLRKSAEQRMELLGSQMRFNVSAPQLSATTEYAAHQLAVLQGRTHRIGFSFRQGKLVALKWDEEDLSAMLSPRLQRIPLSSSADGLFGLMNNRSHGTYMRPVINNEQQRFER